MSKKQLKQKKVNKKGGLAVSSGLMGAAAGAAFGAAAGIMLGDQKTRERIGSTMGEFKDQAIDVFGDLQENVSDMSDGARNSLPKSVSKKMNKKVQ